jgi:trigger factor
MQATETKAEGLKREYALKVPATELEQKIATKLDAVRQDFQMKGFRKGKAPAPLLKKMFGKSVLGEVVKESVDDAVQTHFRESGDQPAQQPQIRIANEDFDEGQDLDIEVAYERLPEVPAVDFGTIKLERLTVEVEDDAVREALENLAKTAENFEAKEGAAEAGDQIVIDFVGKIDGEAFEGGSAEDYPLTLGSNSFIPGFEEKLIGASAGESREVEVSFPDEYGAKHLAGKAATFSTTVKEVRAPKPAEIDDELAKKFGMDDLEALKAQLRERLAEEYKGAARALLKRRLLDALDERVEFELPESLVDAEARQIAHQLWHEEHPEHPGHDHEPIEPSEEHRGLARRRVSLGLLLAEIGKNAGVKISDQEIGQALMRQARNYPGREREFFEFARQNEGIMQQIRAPIFEDKVVDYILELAEVSENPVSKDALQAELDKLDEETPAAEKAAETA